MSIDRNDTASDYTRREGGAAVGARLRRLSERIDGDAARLYAACGVVFEQRWFGVLNQLALNGPMSVGELTGPLGVRHASVSQAAQSLEKARLIVRLPDPADARSRKLALTGAGTALMSRMAPLFEALIAVAHELEEEAGAVAALDRLDAALDRQSLFSRVMARLPDTPARSR